MEPVLQLELLLGRQLDIVHWFMDWTPDNWDETLVRQAAQSGRTPLITWEANGLNVQDIASGKHDTYLKGWAEGVRAYSQPLYLRPFPEMNGSWTSWHGDPISFVAAWRHVVYMFKQAGVTNVHWVWSPNVTDTHGTPPLETYYPGSDVVDILGIDGYNWGNSQSWSDWRSFDSLFQDAYRRISALGSQPVWITETACAEGGGNKSEWVKEMFASTAFPRLAAIIWFNEDKEADWRINSSVDAISAFQQGLSDSVLAGQQYPQA